MLSIIQSATVDSHPRLHLTYTDGTRVVIDFAPLTRDKHYAPEQHHDPGIG